MTYKICEYNRLKVDVDKLLPEIRGGFKTRFVDNLLTVIFGRWTIDIVRFDDWLHELYGDYESEGLSMREIILDKMGPEALKLIENLI